MPRAISLKFIAGTRSVTCANAREAARAGRCGVPRHGNVPTKCGSVQVNAARTAGGTTPTARRQVVCVRVEQQRDTTMRCVAPPHSGSAGSERAGKVRVRAAGRRWRESGRWRRAGKGGAAGGTCYWRPAVARRTRVQRSMGEGREGYKEMISCLSFLLIWAFLYYFFCCLLRLRPMPLCLFMMMFQFSCPGCSTFFLGWVYFSSIFLFEAVQCCAHGANARKLQKNGVQRKHALEVRRVRSRRKQRYGAR